tara:strand:- start:333 stop:749 length:417 start_codon:yes stop_codon:yes gene_type:complete
MLSKSATRRLVHLCSALRNLGFEQESRSVLSMLKTSAKKEDETQEAVLDSYYRALTDTTEDEADLIRELIEFYQSKGKSAEEALVLAVAEMDELNEETSQYDPTMRFDVSPQDRAKAKDFGAISIADMFAPINEDISS